MPIDMHEDDNNSLQTELNSDEEARNLLTKGRLLYSDSSYNQEAFDLFSKAKNLNPNLTEAWIQLAKCCEQKGDINSAIQVLEEALKHCDPDKPNKIILRTLSAFIRQQISKKCDNQEIKVAALLKSLDLSKEALKTDLHDPESYYNLAKAYMCLFFVTECVDQQLINLSRAAFIKALNLSFECVNEKEKTKDILVLNGSKLNANEFKNDNSSEEALRPFIEQSDFLFNYSSVLIYLQEFQKALEYLRLAIKWESDWDEPKLQEECLVDYLKQIYSMVHEMSKSNKRLIKRYCKVVESLKNVEKIENVILYDQRRLAKSQRICVKSYTLKDLQSMQYGSTTVQQDMILRNQTVGGEVKLLHLKLVNTVNYNQAMYLTFVAIDQDYSLIVVTIYNLAESRCPSAKDIVTIVDPKIEQITVDNLNTNDKDSRISFARINVREFKSIYVNGCRITIDQVSKPQFKVSLLP